MRFPIAHIGLELAMYAADDDLELLTHLSLTSQDRY